MPAAQASIRTPNAAVYLTRLCGHAGKMATAVRHLHRPRPNRHAGPPPRFSAIHQTDDQAVITLDRGQFTLRAQPGQLTIHVQADDQASLQRIQDLLTTRLHTISRREPLTITWQPAPDQEDPSHPR
jgi:hypothetical protein